MQQSQSSLLDSLNQYTLAGSPRLTSGPHLTIDASGPKGNFAKTQMFNDPSFATLPKNTDTKAT